MSAKFLHGISDDPQVEKQIDKQIGCMTGFLQLFDRHQILTGKRLYGPKRLAGARSCSNSPRLDATVDSAPNATSEDGQQPSVDSSDFSNAASRASSMDFYDNTRQPIVRSENVEAARATYQSKAKENPARLSVDNRDVKAAYGREHSRAPILSREQPRSSLDSSRHSLDIRDVVRDSFNRDTPKFSMDTRISERVKSRVDATKHAAKLRPSTDGRDTTPRKESTGLSPKSKPKFNEQTQASSDLAGKLMLDAKLKKASGNFMDNKEPTKTPLESKEAPRFSYDGREIPRSSLFEYKDAFRSSLKLREAPRLSLDSRTVLEQRERLCGKEIRNDIGDDKQGLTANELSNDELACEKKRPPSVVARLMGLEAMPDSSPTSSKKAELRRSASESRITHDILHYRYTEGNNSQFKSSIDLKKNTHSKAVEVAAPRQLSSSPKQPESASLASPMIQQAHQFQNRFDDEQSSGRKEETLQQMLWYPDGRIQGSFSPHLKQNAAAPKPINTQRFPIETAPWRQRENWHSYQQNAFEARKFPPENKRNSPQGTDDLYSEIEKRLKQRGLEESGKDLETLKQILEAMQFKGFLHSQKNKEMNQNQQSSFLEQSSSNAPDHMPKMRIFHEAKMLSREREMQSKFTRPFEAPIVVMKPSKLLSNLKPVRTSESLTNNLGKMGYGSSQIVYKGNSNKASSNANNAKTRESANRFGNEIAPAARQRREHIANEALQREPNSRRPQTSISPQPLARTPPSSSALNSLKSQSSSTANKQRNTKAEVERKVKHSGSIIKEKDHQRGSVAMHSPKAARQITGKKIGPDRENKSPRNKMKIKQVDAMEFVESELSSSLDNLLADETSLFSDGNGSTRSHMRLEKPSVAKNREDEKHDADTKYIGGNILDRCDGTLAPIEIPEQPSPVSVLDSSFYKEDCSPSPIMKRSINFTEVETRQHDEPDLGTWNRLSFITRQYQLDELKLDEHLTAAAQTVLKITSNGFQKAEMDSVESIVESESFHCINTNHNSEFGYLADILLASGLLEDKENNSVVFHSSGFPVDPQLYFVLEQRRANVASSKLNNGLDSYKKTDLEKINRQLIFNTTNEILCRKLSPHLHLQPQIYSSNKIQRKRPSGQQLLKQVWDEFQSLPSAPSEDICDTLCTILQKDLADTRDLWSDHTTEHAEVVLDIERMIFKDLIDETIWDMAIVSGQCRQSNLVAGTRRQLHFN
eukprot:Gb_11462 [translate_table: standard]